jgi:hypothetical protein
LNNKNEEINLEGPEPSPAPKQPEHVQPAEEPQPAESVEKRKKEALEQLTKSEPSKTKKFFQKALIWLVVIVVAFGAGFLLDHFLRYQPAAESLRQTQAELVNLQDDLAAAESKVEQMTPKLEAANAKIATLEDDLEMANARVQLYKILVDVTNARLSLFLEDIEGAQSALDETKMGLDALGPVIEKVDEELALSMSRRLELIIAGLERDPETAGIDLELFTKDLLALEPLLFGE